MQILYHDVQQLAEEKGFSNYHSKCLHSAWWNEKVPVELLHLSGKCPLHYMGNYLERLFQQRLYRAILQYPMSQNISV